MPPPVNPELVKKEREELQKVVLKSFAANPRTVSTFGRTTLSWATTVPPNSPFDIDIVLDGEVVQAEGSKVVTLASTKSFSLGARTEHASRGLRRLSVTVDRSDCRTETLFTALLIEAFIKGEFDERFTGRSDFHLRGNGTSVRVGDGTISISVPIEIEVPNWFNADMDIGIKLAVSAGNPVLVTAPTVSVDVSWSFFEHLGSLFCTGVVQSGMEKLAQAFIADIVQAELVSGVASTLSGKVKDFLDGLTAADPQHRTYVPTLVGLSSDGFSVTGCPRAQ